MCPRGPWKNVQYVRRYRQYLSLRERASVVAIANAEATIVPLYAAEAFRFLPSNPTESLCLPDLRDPGPKTIRRLVGGNPATLAFLHQRPLGSAHPYLTSAVAVGEAESHAAALAWLDKTTEKAMRCFARKRLLELEQCFCICGWLSARSTWLVPITYRCGRFV